MRYLFTGLMAGLLMVSVARPAVAQRGWQLGVLSSGNVSTLVGAELSYGSEEQRGAGFGFGLTARYGFSDRVSIRLDVRGERRAPRIRGTFRDPFNYPMGDGYIRQRYDAVVVPVLAQLRLSRHFYAFGGPLAQVLRQQAEVSDFNIWYWPGDHPTYAYTDEHVDQMMVDYTSKLARLGAGGLLGAGCAFRLADHGTLFVEMSYALTATEALRDGFALYNNDPAAQQHPHYDAPTTRRATLRTLSLTAGVCFGAAQP